MADDKPVHDNDVDADDQDHRAGEIARVVKDYLREGEKFTVQCIEDEIVVEEAPDSKFQRQHPRLYGRLLSLNEQMQTGCGLTIVLFLLGGVFCFGLHAGWWDEAMGDVANKLRTWWFYVPLFVVLFFIADTWTLRQERQAYRRGRAELLLLLRNEGFDRDTLVPVIQGIAEFDKVSKQLKLDPGPFLHEG